MFHIVLVSPEIPPNTGNIIRLCANTGMHLHLVEPLGFRLDDAKLRRAGLDYHEFASVQLHPDWFSCEARLKTKGSQSFWALTTKGTASPYDVAFQKGDVLVFGSETKGLPYEALNSIPVEQRLRLPMLASQRSLNLSNAAAVVIYEAWRQHGFDGAAPLP
jgi:tRNA (cytidine/uridine-2'-O-)-methyltransferase